MKNNEIKNNGLSVVSKADYAKLETAKAIILDAQERAEGLAERIAGQLYIVNINKLYELEDCKTTAEWADKEFGISKGTVSDAVNTFARFGDMDNKDRIAEKYSQFMFSSLIKMKGLSDEQIDRAGILPTMSRKQIVDAISALKVLEDKEAELPKLKKEWSNTYKTLTTFLDDDTAEVFITNVVPEFFKDGHETTANEYESLVEDGKELIESHTKWEDIKPIVVKALDCSGNLDNFYADVLGKGWNNTPMLTDVFEKLVEAGQAVVDEYNNNATPFDESNEQESNEQDTAQQESNEQDAPHSMPTITINIADFMKDGKPNMKELLARVKEESAKVIAHEADIVITYTE